MFTIFDVHLCDTDYVGYRGRQLHQRIACGAQKFSVARHILEAHGNNNLLKRNPTKSLRKWQGKFSGLFFEMLLIKNLKANLIIQTDSMHAKRFVYFYSYVTCSFYNHLFFCFLVFIDCNAQTYCDVIMTFS